jgi:NAD(P)-dependent dehydrogenase (short-subunit alcohol dehydrogenase family)
VKRPAVVTGGATGIGFAVAERLLDDGWPVAIIDADAEAISEAEERLGDEDAIFIRADLTDEEEMEVAFDQCVDAFGPLAALVNASSHAPAGGLDETTGEFLREVLEVNLVATLTACLAGVERRGDELAIVNLCAAAGQGRLAYGIAQAGIRALTEGLAVELGPKGVRVNGVCTGADEHVETLPLRRVADEDEVAGAVAYLLSIDASYVSGHVLVVDGGMSKAG